MGSGEGDAVRDDVDCDCTDECKCKEDDPAAEVDY